ncbi:MAG: UDP-N-acetylmuramoyl-L-alanine--D-glutamate ligase [Bacteroidetes bacterium]|nr:UDP-N-acetylmuramoyl-L-alanine--D-glutamate ligase [Bacteroidota bacterium]
MDLAKIKYIVVLGAGESGTGAALLSDKQGFKTFVSDGGEIKESFRNELIEQHIDFEEGKHSFDKILRADLIIKSPGIKESTEVMQAVFKKEITVISEIEFASYFTQAKIISITGSNGKTTTTMLIYHILKTAGLNVTYGGNIGVSFARRILEGSFDYIVLELSSFQLDYLIAFRSHIAILLNITPDHLDRYNYSLEEYALSKMRISMNQTEDDYFLYDLDDEISMQYINKVSSKGIKLPFTQNQKLEKGSWLEGEHIKVKINEQFKVDIDMNILSLVGKHNRYNSMAASTAACALDIKDDVLRKSLSSFQNIEHRLEFIAKIQGKEFINDSKATNLNAVWYALESMNKRVIWIVGGIDKGNNYNEIMPLVKEKVKGIICLGVDNKKILDAFNDEIEMIFETTSMNDAVEIGFRMAIPGEVILLSPACASFDLFKNYEDRGNQFKNAVKNL